MQLIARKKPGRLFVLKHAVTLTLRTNPLYGRRGFLTRTLQEKQFVDDTVRGNVDEILVIPRSIDEPPDKARVAGRLLVRQTEDTGDLEGPFDVLVILLRSGGDEEDPPIGIVDPP